MAKSIRSKRKRKMRNVKREKYGKRELARLKDMIKNSSLNEEVKDIVKFKAAKDIIQDTEMEDKTPTGEKEVMDVDTKSRIYNKKTLRDQDGHYPPWMNQRKVKRHKKKLGENKKLNKAKKAKRKG